MNRPDLIKKIKYGAVELIGEKELFDRLKSNRQLKIKFGIDPTAKEIHLGHTIVLNKLRQFQDLDHQAILVIGDFTARIGDPTGCSKTRKPLSEEEIAANVEDYQRQLFKILIPEKTKIVYNSQWLEGLTSREIIKLTSHFTVARMLERDDFAKRYKNYLPITLREFLYPLFQGYDSMILKSDIELGGTDQTFNLLVGRELQKIFKEPPQIIMTMPLIEGLDGVRKMSKSFNNYIAIDENPNEMFGKLMSISDETMWRYLEIFQVKTREEIDKLRVQSFEKINPRDVKIELATKLVSRFHSTNIAKNAATNFINQFKYKKIPQSLPTMELKIVEDKISISQVLKLCGLTTSRSQAIRIIKQNGLRIDHKIIIDPDFVLAKNSNSLIQVGKRKFIRLDLI